MSIAVGTGSSFGINEHGQLYTWGRNEYGQLGQQYNLPHPQLDEYSSTPAHVQQLQDKVKTVSANKNRVACIMENGSVVMFGQANVDSQLHVHKPPKIIPVHGLGGDWPVQVVCNDIANYILTESGKVFETISQERPAVNNVYTELFFGPTALTGFMGLPVRMLAVAAGHVVAIGQHHGMWTWGVNTHGSLGLLVEDGQLVVHPTVVPFFVRHTLKYAAAGMCRSMVVSMGTGDPGADDKGVYGWGYCEHGELGFQTEPMVRQLVPRRINPRFFAYEDVAVVTCDHTYSAVLTESGRVWLFGEYLCFEEDPLQAGLADIEITEWAVPADQDDIHLLRLPSTGLPDDVTMFNDMLPREMCLDPFRGAKVVNIAGGRCHMLLCTDNGLLFRWNGSRPALFHPLDAPQPELVQHGSIVRQPYFGDFRVRMRHRMSRDDAANFALGRFATNAEYHAHMQSRRSRQARHRLMQLGLLHLDQVPATAAVTYTARNMSGPFHATLDHAPA